MTIVKSQRGETVQLSSQPLARGGEGSIYTVPAYPNAVVKIFHPELRQKRGALLEKKIALMTTHPQFEKARRDDALAWPRFVVLDGSGQWLGYAMKKVSGVQMNVLAHAMAYQEHFPQLDRKILSNVLLGWLEKVGLLHSLGIRIGDYNLANFLIDHRTLDVSFIDCDAWQLEVDGQRFFCPVGTVDMVPMEHQDHDLNRTCRTLESEAFSVAIVLFKALMLGRHPYDAIGAADPVTNIRKGYFPYGKNAGGIPRGVWYNVWSHMSYLLKNGFITTFKDGAQQPSARLSVQEWRKLFRIYLREMQDNKHEAALRPTEPKAGTYRGTQSLESVSS